MLWERRCRPTPMMIGALLIILCCSTGGGGGQAGAWLLPQGYSRRAVTARSNRYNTGRTQTAANDVVLFESSSQEEQEPQPQRTTPSEEERPEYFRAREIDENLLGDLTGGRPGAIIETEEQLAIKRDILQEMGDGTDGTAVRKYPKWAFEDYGESIEDEEAEYDVDDPDLVDAQTLGTWTIEDIRSRFDYDWDPLGDSPDPNIVELNQPGVRYIDEAPKDDDNVELGYDPIFGPSSPLDRRTILGTKDSYMIDDATRDDSMLTPQFKEDDPEIRFNQDVVRFRKSLDIIETYVDPFLPQEMEIPRHVAKWHGYPERTFFEPKNYTNNRFTPVPTDFDAMAPADARRRAVELARSKNAEWLPDGVSQQWHQKQRQVYEDYGTLVGTLREGDCDPEVVDMIQPALQVLGSCVDLLSIIENDGSPDDDAAPSYVFRFAYHGLMKNKHGMRSWTETLLSDCGVEVTGVVFETGFRKRDAAYDGGDKWNGPTF